MTLTDIFVKTFIAGFFTAAVLAACIIVKYPSKLSVVYETVKGHCGIIRLVQPRKAFGYEVDKPACVVVISDFPFAALFSVSMSRYFNVCSRQFFMDLDLLDGSAAPVIKAERDAAFVNLQHWSAMYFPTILCSFIRII